MADLAVTAASVAETATTQISVELAAENITAGTWLYRDAATSNQLRKGDSLTAAKAAIVGMAMNGGDAGQRIRLATGGDVTLNAIGVTPWVCVLSNTATSGKMCVASDLNFGAGNIATDLGAFSSTTNFKINIVQSGQAK